VACFFLGAFCLSLIGCSLFGKKSQTKENAPPAQAGAGGGSASTDASGAYANTPVGANGILAGRVIDSYEHKPPPTYIQVVLASDSRGSKPAPMEVATDSQGFFTIQGLQAGQHYQLIARTRDSSPRLAGTTWATPPNPRLLIYMSEDFATPNTPGAPPPPVIPGPRGNTAPGATDKTGSAAEGGNTGTGEPKADGSKPPSSNLPPQRPAEIGSPLRINGQPQGQEAPPAAAVPPAPSSGLRTEDIAANPNGYARNEPALNIPSTVPTPTTQPLQPSAPYDLGTPTMATRVPSCVLTGRQLDNFALNDLTGQPWEYRTHRCRLTLLDFWGTWCIPCRESITHLKIFQNNYGPYGLRVVGIAYEQGSPAEQIRKVQDVRDRQGINYQLLLGSDSATCPVRTQFAVTSFPTFVLIDQNNRILCRSEGLTGENLEDLTIRINEHLRAR